MKYDAHTERSIISSSDKSVSNYSFYRSRQIYRQVGFTFGRNMGSGKSNLFIVIVVCCKFVLIFQSQIDSYNY